MPVTLKQVKTLVINRATECKFIGNALNLVMQLAPKIMILRGGSVGGRPCVSKRKSGEIIYIKNFTFSAHTYICTYMANLRKQESVRPKRHKV